MPRTKFQPGPATDHYHATVGVDEIPVDELGGAATSLEAVLTAGNETGENTIVMPSGYIDGTTAFGALALLGFTGPANEAGGVAIIGGGPSNEGDVGSSQGGIATFQGGQVESGGEVDLRGGDAVGNGDGGPISLEAGAGFGLGSGGNVSVQSGDSALGATGAALGLYGAMEAGGNAEIQTGSAAVGSDADGGDIVLTTGLGDGAGRDGRVLINGTPIAPLYQATVTLTDAQIKALPSTGTELVPAPGVGMAILPISALVSCSIVTGYDTPAEDAALRLLYGGTVVASSLLPVNLTTTGSRAGLIPSLGQVDAAFDPDVIAPVVTATTVDDEALLLKDDWSGSSPFTGGNAANTLKITVLYTVVEL